MQRYVLQNQASAAQILSCAPKALAKLKQQVASGDSRHERHNVRCEMLWADDGVFS